MTKQEEKILQLSREVSIYSLSLREIGRRVGIKHPQTVKNTLLKLKKKGLLKDVNNKDFLIGKEELKEMNSIVYKIPILGEANCGLATLSAKEDLKGFLIISNSILKRRPNLFALVASGNSMDRANINGENINDGDYVIVDSSSRDPQNGDYIVSVIDGCANIKKYEKDSKRKRIILLSESKSFYPPIYIHENDFSSYFVNGKVIKVIKKPDIE